MNLLAGGLAGAASLALVYPFEFATIRLAAELGPEAQHAGAQQHPHQQLSKHARVTRAGTQQLLHMVRTEGLLACYRGLGVSMVGMMAYKALFFGLYDTGEVLLVVLVSGDAGLTASRVVPGNGQRLYEAMLSRSRKTTQPPAVVCQGDALSGLHCLSLALLA